MQKKRVPRDTTAIQKKIEERKKEEIEKVEDRFAELLRDSKAIEKEEKKYFEFQYDQMEKKSIRDQNCKKFVEKNNEKCHELES